MVRSLSRRNFTSAAVLAGFAGFVDGFGFSYLGGFFVSFMSGNTTRASVELVAGAWDGALLAGSLIVSFVIGAMAGTVFSGTRHGETRVLLTITVALTVAALVAFADWRPAVGMLLAFAMGAKNMVFARGGEVAFGVTYMTGALVKIGQGIVTALQGGERDAWVRHLIMWLSIAVGAVAGTASFAVLGGGALWIMVAGLVVAVTIKPVRRWLHA